MKFFVPGEEDGETSWQRMRQAFGASVDTRPLYSISCEHEGTEVAVTVGEEGVIAIIAGGETYCIFEGSEKPRSVPLLPPSSCSVPTSRS